MERTPHILVVDDDVEIQKLTKRHLQEFGFLVTVAGNGREMFKALKEWRIDLVVLDVLMPGQDGFALCKELRTTTQLPVIMVTALRDEADRVIGLELGADDYLVKPFGPRELMARIKAVLRRTQSIGKSSSEADAAVVAYSFAGWRLHMVERELQSRDGTVVPLSTREFALLTTFLEHPQRPLSREQLADMVAGRDSGPFDRSIDILVSRLRRKVEDGGKEPTLIKTVRGEGYQLCAEVQRHHRHGQPDTALG
jgi:two-component system OmpR family response regulator